MPTSAVAGGPAGAPAPTPPSKPTGRAGRNLRAAIPVGLVLVGALVASLVFDTRAFAVLATVALLAGEWELARAFRVRHIRVPLIPLWVGTVAMVWATWVRGASGLLALYLLTCGVVILWRALEGHRRNHDGVRDALCGVLLATYLPLLAGFAVLLAAQPQGAALVATVLMLGVANDTGGYIAGVLFGKHPMAPSISPKKSWEGFAGSVLSTAVVGAVLVSLTLGHPWWVGVVLGVAGAAASTLGDFAESLIKRDLGIKDMSNLLPGHGGVLDRLDSLLICSPVSYAVLLVLVGF